MSNDALPIATFAYLDLPLSHAECISQTCAFRTSQVLGLIESLLQRENLVSGKRRSCMLASRRLSVSVAVRIATGDRRTGFIGYREQKGHQTWSYSDCCAILDEFGTTLRLINVSKTR